ncbi:MAG: phosphatidate cytidylyltransferase [Methylophaga sp.]|nr:MAG: phosphatidate cytidylyltransferase [Methylophaga sp.]
MLKQRLLTAAVLIPLVVVSLLYLPTSIVQWLLAGVVVLAAWEWFAIIGFKALPKALFALLALALITVMLFLLSPQDLLVFSTVLWLIILALVSRYAHSALPIKIEKIIMQPVLALILASLVLALFWHSAVLLHSTPLGAQQLLYIMVLVWLADTGGYFAGKRWGKTKLAKAISPNKTWEGVAGAVFLGATWSIIGYALGLSGTLSLVSWLGLSLLALLISIVGDLFESLFKRAHNVKDSGNLLPGHGGMLDRIDSLLAAVPVFTAGLFWLGAY